MGRGGGPEKGACALDEVGFIGAGRVDGRGLSGGLLAAGHGQVDAAEQGTKGTQSELESDGG